MKSISEKIMCLIILSWIVTMFLVSTNECCEIAVQEACEIAVQEVYETEGWRVE